MTLPDERTRAVLTTRDFLRDLLTGKYKRVPKEVREQAARCLRHFPGEFDMYQALDRAYEVFGDCEMLSRFLEEPKERTPLSRKKSRKT